MPTCALGVMDSRSHHLMSITTTTKRDGTLSFSVFGCLLVIVVCVGKNVDWRLIVE